jgi:hypothetical protein
MERNFVSLPENEGHFHGQNPSFAVMYKKLIIFFFSWRYNALWVCILQPSSGL